MDVRLPDFMIQGLPIMERRLEDNILVIYYGAFESDSCPISCEYNIMKRQCGFI
jgi:hypothetical protein